MGVNYPEAIERMKKVGGVKSSSALARILGVTPQALSNYKKRGIIPADLILKFASLYGLSVDWLLTGEGQMYINGEKTTTASEDDEDIKRAGSILSNMKGLTGLDPDEIIYIGKLLKIFRGVNKNTATALKYSIDAFLRVATMPIRKD